MYSEQYRWNSPNVDKGNLAVWHEKYSIPHTVVFGKVAVSSNLNIIWMGSSERHWGKMKHIKSGNHSHISTEKTEKQLMIYTKARLDKSKVRRNNLENLNDACAAWGDEDEKFNLGLEKFGVDIDALNMPAVPKRYFRCWIEDW